MPSVDPRAKGFKKQISALKRSHRFIPWGQSKYLASELEDILNDIRTYISDPYSGAILVADFYTTDLSIFNRCDDSSGTVGDVYRYYAAELFRDYACRCDDKKKLADLVYKTIIVDDYGVRDSLLDHAGEYLPKDQCQRLIDKLQQLARQQDEEFHSHSFYSRAATLARQIKDPQQFESIELASWGKQPNSRVVMDIARTYLECGQAETAKEKLLSHGDEESHWRPDLDRLLIEICQATGDKKLEIETSWRLFRFQRDAYGFTALVDLIGVEHRNRLLAEEIDLIKQRDLLSLTDLNFLVQMKQWDAAESYIYKRAGQLDGNHYNILPDLAADLETVGHSLAATVVYRTLLDSILTRAQTKTYGHGACVI